MKERIEPTIEKKERGKNIFQRDIYYRHGEKTPEGKLAPEGFKQAEEIGEALETTEKGPKPYHSEVERAEKFAKTIQKVTESKKEYKARTRFELGLSGLSKEWIVEWQKRTKEEGGVAALEWYLSFGKEKPDAGTMSPYEMASRVARNILTHSKMAERYYNGSKVDLINGSHSPSLDVFIAIALKEQVEKNPINSKGENITEKMGGRFKTAEQFEVDTIINDEGEKTLNLLFRNKGYELAEGKLEEMAARVDKEKLMEETADQRKKRLEKEKKE